MGDSASANVRPGRIAVDRDDPDPDPTVVVNTPPCQASEWTVPGGTVAEANPEYDAAQPVVSVVYRSELVDSPYRKYSGPRPLKLRDLQQAGVSVYTFPRNRLEIRSQREPATLPTEALLPNPYHVESYRPEESRDLIESMGGEEGFSIPVLAHRLENGRYQLLNGHRRIWVATLLDIDEVPARVYYDLPPQQVARKWAKHHLEELEAAEQQRALERIRTRLGERTARQLAGEYADREAVERVGQVDGGGVSDPA